MRQLRRTILLIGAATLLLLVTLAIAPFTAGGSRVLVDIISRYSPLQMEYGGGAILSNLRLVKLDLELPDISLAVSELETKLDIACFWHSTFCFSLLSAERVQLSWDGGQWQNASMRARVSVNEAQILVEELSLDDAYLEVQATEDEASSADFPVISMPLDLVLKRGEIKRAHWLIDSGEYRHDLITLSGQWRDSVLSLEEVVVRNEGLGFLRLSASLQFEGEWPFELEASANLDSAFSASTLFDLPAELDELSPLSPWLLSVQGTFSEQQFSLRGGVKGLGYGALKLGVSGYYQVRSASPDQSKLVFDTIELSDAASDSRLLARGELNVGQRSDWHFSLNSGGFELPSSGNELKGRLQGGWQAQGSFFDASWKLDLEQIDIRGEINGLPARVEGQLALDNNLLVSKSSLRAELNSAQLRLLAGEGEGHSARLVLIVEQLERWLEGGRGSLELEAELGPGVATLGVEGSLANFHWNNIDFERAIVVGDIALDEDMAFNMDVGISDVLLAGTELEHLKLDVVGDANQQALHIRSSGDIEGVVGLTGVRAAKVWRGELMPTRLDTPLGSWQLGKAVTLQWDGNSRHLQIDEHCWRSAHGKLCPGKSELLVSDEDTSFASSIELSGGSDLVSALIPQDIDLQSDLDLALDVRWSGSGGPRLSGEFTMGKGFLRKPVWGEEFASIDWDAARMRFNYTREKIQLVASMQQGSVNTLSVELDLPSKRNAPLSGELFVTQMDLRPLQPFFPGLSSLRGVIDGQIRLSGTPDQPEGRGELNLDDGYLTMIDMPTAFESLQLTLKLQGDEAEINGNVLLGGGPLDISGILQYRPQPLLQLKLVGRGEKLVFPPSVQARVSHDLTLTATPEYLSLEGEVRVHKGLLEHEELPAGSVNLSDDVVELSLEGQLPERKSAFDIAMDVNVSIEDSFRISGGIVNVTVGGDLQLLQERGYPLQLFGNLNVIGGELNAYGQNLKVKRGTVLFSGAPENPTLDMRADRLISKDDVTVGLELRGTLDAPILEVYSDPAMARTEALSYLLRGRGLDTGASADGAAVALSMGTSLLNQSGVFNKLEKLPGVSGVELSAEGSDNDTTATISGYIGRNIYLAYGVGLYEPINVLTARFYLKTRLWLEVVSSLENSMDLYYSFDIE